MKVGGSIGGVSGTEENICTSKVVACPGPCSTDGEVMGWEYTINDKNHCEFGRQFDETNRPWVKVGFSEGKLPHLEVEMLVYWTTPTSRITDGIAHFRRRKLPPVFTNLLQQVSISLPLDKLRGDCWSDGRAVVAETNQPLLDDKRQCYADGKMPVKNKHGSVDNLDVAFACALYGNVITDRLKKAQKDDMMIIGKCLR